MSSPQNIIIFGSRSYIGYYLSSFFQKRGLNIICVSSENCNLLDPYSIRAFFNSLNSEKYVVLFLAVINRPKGDCFEGFEKNIQMIENFIESHDSEKISSLIYFSSVDVYGNQPPLPIDETTPVAPDNWYGLAKFNGEWMLKKSLSGKIPIIIFRLPGIYGPSPNENSIINKFIAQIRQNQQVVIRGDGSILRDYLHLDDLSRVVEQLLPLNENNLINLATGQNYSLAEIIQMIQKHISASFEIIYQESSNSRDFDLSFNIEHLRKTLPDFQFTDLEKGIQKYFV